MGLFQVFDVLKGENLHGLELDDLTGMVEWEDCDGIRLWEMVGEHMGDIGEGLLMLEKDKEVLMNMEIDTEIALDR